MTVIPDNPAERLQAAGFRPMAAATANQATLGPFPPGAYLVLAYSEDDPSARGLASLGLKRIRDLAVRVELHEGATATVKMKPLTRMSIGNQTNPAQSYPHPQ